MTKNGNVIVALSIRRMRCQLLQGADLRGIGVLPNKQRLCLMHDTGIACNCFRSVIRVFEEHRVQRRVGDRIEYARKYRI